MNERIADILEQAFTLCKKYEDEGETGLVKTTQAFSIFAELIVRECAKVCEHNAIYLNHLSKKSDGDDGILSARADESDECASLIKEHFGVEK